MQNRISDKERIRRNESLNDKLGLVVAIFGIACCIIGLLCTYGCSVPNKASYSVHVMPITRDQFKFNFDLGYEVTSACTSDQRDIIKQAYIDETMHVFAMYDSDDKSMTRRQVFIKIMKGVNQKFSSTDECMTTYMQLDRRN